MLMEQRLEQEEEPMLTDAEMDRKLVLEKQKRWQLIEIFFTMRESDLDEQFAHDVPLAVPNSSLL